MNNRWESYVMYHQEAKLVEFWKEFYKNKPATHVLFLLGKGFDPRMNNILRLLLQTVKSLQVECIAFDFPDGSIRSENSKLYSTNVQDLNNLQAQYGFTLNEIQIDSKLTWDKRIALMSRQINDKDLSSFNEIILDVSSLPRAFYFNIAKALFNKLRDNYKQNLFFAVSENVEIDNEITKNVPIDNIEALRGFKSMLSVESILDRVNILIPLIGEKNVALLRSIYNHFQPFDMFPVLPFPSKNPRRSDELLQEYHGFFSEKQFTEPQSITYADEQNPFELYRIVSQMISEHQKTLKPISEHVCFGIALLTSKLLSLGALLLGLEHNNCVAIYNVSSTDYNIENSERLKEKNANSEPFLMWITGEAYSGY